LVYWDIFTYIPLLYVIFSYRISINFFNMTTWGPLTMEAPGVAGVVGL